VRLRTRLRPFVPPILWTGLSRLKADAEARSAGVKRSVADIVTGESFAVPFIRVTQDRGVYFVPKHAEHRPACQAVLRGHVYEPRTHELIAGILRRRTGSLVHAGAFFGDMLPTFSRACPGMVHAFEPVLENYVLAKLCVDVNGLENVHLQNAALSDRVSIARIDTGDRGRPHRGGSSRVGETGQPVALVTIDGLCLEEVAVIQLDVEGHELSALTGARATIARHAPVIMIEDTARSCDAFLGEMGYECAGTIPGLSVWTRPAERGLVADLLPDG